MVKPVLIITFYEGIQYVKFKLVLSIAKIETVIGVSSAVFFYDKDQ
jgi:hypothetical protein